MVLGYYMIIFSLYFMNTSDTAADMKGSIYFYDSINSVIHSPCRTKSFRRVDSIYSYFSVQMYLDRCIIQSALFIKLYFAMFSWAKNARQGE